MKWLFEIYPVKKKYILINTLRSLARWSDLIPSILIGIMIDKFRETHDPKVIIPYAVAVFIIVVVGSITSFKTFVESARLKEKLVNTIRNKCYKKFNELDRTFYNENPSGDLVTMMTSDMQSIGSFYFYVSINIIMNIVSFVLVFGYFLTINLPLTLCILIPSPFLAYITSRFNKKIENLYDEKREQSAELNNYIQENIEGNKVVKSFGNEEYEINKFKKKNKEIKNKNLEIRKLNINYDLKVNFLTNIMNAILLAIGGLFMLKGYITIGELLVFSSLTYAVQAPFLDLAMYFNDYKEFKVSLKKIKDFLNTKSKIVDDGKLKLNYKNQNITIKDVDVLYEDTIGIKDMNLEIKPGETIAFIGEVGSGKSTITRILLRHTNISSGEILIGKNKIEEYTLESLRNEIGYVSQTPFLFSDTIKNNVNYGDLTLTDKDATKYLKMAKADYALELTDGINTIIGENGVSLSGGEKQRLSLARALAKKPKILILDDITSALDIETEISVTENIKDLAYKCTKIIIAQKIFSVKDADKILVFKNNKVAETGTHKELLKLNGVYKNIYDTQKESYEELI
jgi:ABC-type multidrug transport system, ATPase and permease components